MFGTLRPPRLAESDRLAFRAHYCAGCHALREFGGRPLSLLTTYDQTFVLLLIEALRGRRTSSGTDAASGTNAASNDQAHVYQAHVYQAPCTALPFRSVRVQQIPAETRARVAAVSVLLTDAKLADDVDDRSAIARPLFRGGRTLLAPPADRARALLGDEPLVQRIAELPARQLETEATGSLRGDRRLDALSAPTREVLAEVFSYVGRLAIVADASGELHPEDPTLRQLGDSLGEAIYLFDAVDDVERDHRRGRFNALVNAWGESWPLESTATRLSGAIDAATAAIETVLPAGQADDARSTLLAVLRGFRARALRTLGNRNATELLPPHLVSQAGDCDLDCCCSCDSCSCGNVGCGGGDEAKSSCFFCIDTAEYCTCCDCCCWSSDRKEKRKQKRKGDGQGHPVVDPADGFRAEPKPPAS